MTVNNRSCMVPNIDKKKKKFDDDTVDEYGMSREHGDFCFVHVLTHSKVTCWHFETSYKLNKNLYVYEWKQRRRILALSRKIRVR